MPAQSSVLTNRKTLVTGATGLIGRAVVKSLIARGQTVVAARRGPAAAAHEMEVGDVGPQTDWARALEGCSAVIHLAGEIPGRDTTEDSLHRVNVEGTARLVEQAQAAGVVRFVFLSSIAAIVDHASSTIVTDQTAARPSSAYGRSKLAAEESVAAFASKDRASMSIRPPVVYAPDSHGSWRMLMKLAASGLPLPFAAVANRRSMISLANLTDAAVTCLAQAKPGDSGAYAVAEAQPYSLAQIVRLLRQGMGLPERQVAIPAGILRNAVRLTGKAQMAKSLFENLEIDSRRFRDKFGWKEPVEGEHSLRICGESFARQDGRF